MKKDPDKINMISYTCITARSSKRSNSANNFKNDPPEIIIANQPSVLVIVDAKPILTELKGYDFQKV